MYKIFNTFKAITSILLVGKYWKWKVAAVSTIYCILTSMPNYPNLFENSLKNSPYYSLIIENYQTINTQIDHPFQANEVNIASHSSKVSFRFVPALLVKILPANNIYNRVLCLYLINNLAGFLFFWGLLKLTFLYSENKLYSSLIALNFSVLYVGKSFFHDTYLWNDGIAFTLLLFSLLTKNPIITFLCLLSAYFTDERAIFGAVLVFVYYKLSNNNSDKSLSLGFLIRTDISFLFSFIAYGMIRLLLMHFFLLQTPIGLDSGVSLFLRVKEHSFWLNFMSLFAIYKMGWILIFFSIWWLRKNISLLLCYILGLISLIIIALSVEDITRSFAYSFMALISGFFIYYNKSSQFKIKEPEYGAFLLLAINIFIPTISVVGNITKILPPIDKLITRFL